MLINSADSLWAIKVIASSYPLSTSTGPSGMAGWNANRRAITPSGWLVLANACCGGGSAAALALVARGVWATATHGMTTSKHTATIINWDFIFHSAIGRS